MLLAGGLVAGCSGAWDSVTRPLDPLPPANPDTIDAPQEGAGEYPNLSSVPDQPPRRPSGRSERQDIQQALSSDRANARYSDQMQTGEGIESQDRSAGGTASQADTASGGGMSGAPARPEAADRMPADDAGAATGTGRTPSSTDGGQSATTSQQAQSGADASDTSGAGNETGDSSAGGGTGASSARGDTAPDVPQLQQSEQGEPIEVPAQPNFASAGSSNRPGTTDRGPAGGNETGRAQQQSGQQQSARRGADGMAAPGPEVGRSRTFSRQDTGGQTFQDGGRRVAVIYFRHGSASLQGRDREVLREVADVAEQQDRDLRVVGHASSRTAGMDPLEHRMANFDTSLKRAQAVVDALVSMGVPRDAIQLEARGDNEPVYHEFMPSGEAGNRRAEIFLQG